MILFFDTETNGLPKNYKAAPSDIDNWPRITQIAVSIRRHDGQIYHENQWMIKPNGWTIPTKDQLIAAGSKDPDFFVNNNMSTERCWRDGIPFHVVASHIVSLLRLCHTVVAHNLDFDLPVLQAEFIRLSIPTEFTQTKFCTMKASVDLCQIPGPCGFKWPKLEELFKFLFGITPIGAHDALNDARSCAECYFAMIERPPSISHSISGSLTYSNVTRYLNMPWQEYAALPGYSFSFLKREIAGQSPFFKMNYKIRLGSMVDAILMQQDEVKVSDYLFPHAKKIASAILAQFGTLIKSFQPQVSYSGTLTYNGISMRVKGRPDWEIPRIAQIDLKITEATDIRALIKFMQYDDQQNGYCGLASIPTAYILPYNPKLNKVMDIVSLPYNADNQFWKEKTLRFGSV